MGIPLIDLHFRHIVNFTITTIISNPDRYIAEIFGDAKLDPHAAIYGDKYFQDIKKWITTTKIPVVLGYDLDPTQIPGVSINLLPSSPSLPIMGDVGMTHMNQREPWERDIIVPFFTPMLVTPASDGTYISLVLPDDLAHPELVSPGLIIRDKRGQEYGIGRDDQDNPTVLQTGTALLKDADLTQIEVISPYLDQIVQEGAMVYENNVLFTIHGHSDRLESLWLWAIVQWGLLKYRPLMISLFGMDLTLPSAADFVKADEFLGDNVWKRFITLRTTTVYSWDSTNSQDLVAFILSVQQCQAANS